MRSITYREFLTAVDTDILAGTELEHAPGSGIYLIRAASTVNTATLAVRSTNSALVSEARAITLRANGETRAEDQPWVLFVSMGEKVIIELGGTTGTVGLEVQFMGV